MKKKGGHLLIRIFATYVFTAVLVMGIVGFILWSFKPDRTLPAFVDNNISIYVNALSKEFSDLPEPLRFEKFRSELGIVYRSTANAEIADAKDLPSFDQVEKSDKMMSNQYLFGKYGDYFFLASKLSANQHIWYVPKNSLPKGLGFPIFGVVTALAIILLFSFLTIRMIMSPLSVIMAGVDQISKGNLSYRIQGKYKHEFDVLVRTFNSMASRLERLISNKEHLLRDVSHELRSPLTRIQLAIEMVDDPALKNQIQADVRRMDQLLFDLLESYRLRDGATKLKLADIDLIELLKGIEKDYRDATPEVQFKLQETKPLMMSLDAFQIERVIRNLLENAIKYSMPSPKLNHALQATQNSSSIVLSLEQQAGAIQIKVQDNGIGISPQDQLQIFDPFFRVDQARTPQAGGFGLGLAVCKSIVEAHGGQIEVKSQLGKGSVFTISLLK